MNTAQIWFSSIRNDFERTQALREIHVDELFSDLPRDQHHFFERAVEIFVQIVNLASGEGQFLFNYQIDLRIALLSEDSKIKCVPKSFTELIQSIEMTSDAEILIFVPIKQYIRPALEYYCSLLPFKLPGLSDEIRCVYEEYRAMDELVSNLEYNRWLTLTYFKEVI